MKKVVVIGAGAAGLMAASVSAKLNNDVTIIEKNKRPARKVMITGKGRCNVTNATFDLDELISNVTTNSRFLYSAFSNFMPYDTIDMFENLGVKLKIERGQRVFPETDKAVDIVDALVKMARQAGVKFVGGSAVRFEMSDNKITSVILDNDNKIVCDSVAICTGGAR